MTPLQVLVVEDNPADAFRVREALETGGHGRYQPTFAGRLEEAWPHLRGADLVLLDLSLPDSAGAETVARVRMRAPRLPVVVLSGDRDEEIAFRCLQHGAQDVLLKGALGADALARAISCALERQALARERDGALARARAGEGELRGILDALGEGVVVSDSRRRPLYLNPAAERLLGWERGAGLRRVVDFPRDGVDDDAPPLALRSAPVLWEDAPATLTTIREAPPPPPGAPRPETRRLAVGVAHEVAGLFAPPAGSAPIRASALVDQLRACAGQVEGPLERIDVSELVFGCWERLRAAAPGAATLERDLALGMPPVLAGRERLEEALLLLLAHACAACRGAGCLTVGTRLLPSMGRGTHRAAIEVTGPGSGTGIPADGHLFEPYYPSEVLGIGAGIGLAPVLGIATVYGGTAEALPGPGGGTVLRIVLPIVDEDEIVLAADAAERPARGPGPDPLEGPWFPPAPLSPSRGGMEAKCRHRGRSP